jgi:hypothetical protein
MRTVVFILETIAIALSLLAGLGLVGGPGILRIGLAFCALFLIPGVSLELLAFRGTAPVFERASRIFVLGLVFPSVVVCTGWIPGFSYRAISFVASGLALALAFLAGRKRASEAAPSRDDRRGGAGAYRLSRVRSSLLIAVLFVICFIVFSGSGELGWSTDSLDHVSFVRRSVDSGALFPRDSYYREGDGVSLDPRKGLWHPVLSLWTYQSHEPADVLWRELPAFIAFFAVCAFLFLAVELCGSRLCAGLSLVFLLLFYAGEGFGWLTKLGYSKNIAQIVLWIDLAFLLAYYRTTRRRYLLTGFFVACLGASYHVVFALLVGATLLGLFCYVMLLPGGREWRAVFWRSVPVQLAAVAIPILARWRETAAPFNMIHTHMQGMLVFGGNLAIVDPAELATRYGLAFFYALLMAPFFFLVAGRVRQRSLVFVLFIVPVILVLDPLIASFLERRIGYLHYRILDAAPILVMLALVVQGLFAAFMLGRAPAGNGGARWRPLLSVGGLAGRVLAVLGVVLFVYYPLRSSVPHLRGAAHDIMNRRGKAQPAYEALFRVLNDDIPDHSVIVSDPLTSYVVSAYTDHFVAVTLDQHGSPADTGAVRRLCEARNLMSPAVAFAASAPWLEEERADYVLLNMNLPPRADFFNSVLPEASSAAYGKLLACPSALTEVLALDGFHLFHVRREAPEAHRSASCSDAKAAFLACAGGRGGCMHLREEERDSIAPDAGIDIGAGIELACLTIDNYMLHPGDTLRGHFCWRASKALAFGLPVEAAIRIDTAFPEGKLYRAWYGKQYRRFIERRNERFYRLTWQVRLLSGFTYPDMWEAGRAVRQDFALPLSRALAPGAYELRVKVDRATYLPNRLVSDYLSNDDSLQGVPIGMVYVREQPADAGASSAPRGRDANDRR